MKYCHLFFFTAFLFSCSSSFKIQSDTPFPGDFESYTTFKFFNPENMPATNFSFDEDMKKVIFDAVASEMKAKGYESLQDADLMIKIQGGSKSSVEIRNDNTFYPYDRYNNAFYGNRYGGPYNNYYDAPRDQSEKDTSIIIDIIDITSDKIVWQGVGTGSLGKREDLTEIKVRETISKIFSQFPYQAGRSLSN